VLDKYSRLNIPDNIYNWVESFFQEDSHSSDSTRFGGQVFALKATSASIIQGSVIGPVSYVITVSDLQPASQANFIVKYANDTYMIIPARIISSGPAELTNTSNWAHDYNLEVNLDKSVEMVFVRPRNKGCQSKPPSAISGLRRVESIKMLGVTINQKFLVSQHVDNLLAVCSQSLFALRTLQQHGLPNNALHQVLQATVINRSSYASPAW